MVFYRMSDTGHGYYNDTNKNGCIDEGDTLNLSSIFSPTQIIGSTVKIVLHGGASHNHDTIVGEIEVKIM